MLKSNSFAIPSILMFVTTLAICSGCQFFQSSTSQKIEPASTGAAAPYTVELRGNYGKPTTYHGQIGPQTTVQKALEDSGAIRNYRNMSINLVRRVPEKSTSLKMPVTFDPSKDQVAAETNYQLHVGDRIIVSPKGADPLGSAMSILGF